MPAIQKLNKLSADDLLEELRVREGKAADGARAEPPKSNGNLREFDDAAIVQVLGGKQKVIYGTDDRSEVFQLSAEPDLDDVDCVVALFGSSNVTDNGDGTSSLRTRNFGAARLVDSSAHNLGVDCFRCIDDADFITRGGFLQMDRPLEMLSGVLSESISLYIDR